MQSADKEARLKEVDLAFEQGFGFKDGVTNYKFQCQHCYQQVPKVINGTLTRAIAHLTRQEGNGVRICPSVSDEHAQEIAELAGLELAQGLAGMQASSYSRAYR